MILLWSTPVISVSWKIRDVKAVLLHLRPIDPMNSQQIAR